MRVVKRDAVLHEALQNGRIYIQRYERKASRFMDLATKQTVCRLEWIKKRQTVMVYLKAEMIEALRGTSAFGLALLNGMHEVVWYFAKASWKCGLFANVNIARGNSWYGLSKKCLFLCVAYEKVCKRSVFNAFQVWWSQATKIQTTFFRGSQGGYIIQRNGFGTFFADEKLQPAHLCLTGACWLFCVSHRGRNARWLLVARWLSQKRDVLKPVYRYEIQLEYKSIGLTCLCLSIKCSADHRKTGLLCGFCFITTLSF